MTEAEISAERARRGVPPNGQPLRVWIRFQLQQRTNPDTGKPWSQAAVAAETHASEPYVSRVFSGSMETGALAGRIRRAAARVLDIPEEVLFSLPVGNHNGG